MGFHDFLERLRGTGQLVTIRKPVSKSLEACGLLKALDGRPVLLEQMKEAEVKVAGNVCSTKRLVADYFGVEPSQLVPLMLNAIANPTRPEQVATAPCQEVEIDRVNLDDLPILFHCSGDGGPYVSSGVAVTRDPELGRNLSFHRLMQIGPNRFAARIVQGRHFDKFLQRQQKMPVAVALGNGANVLLAAGVSLALGQDELEIANALEPLRVVKARTSDLMVPADCEFVLEGTVSLEDRAEEGPFVDLTETYDVVRREPVFTVTRITRRRDAVWQALLPGSLEHKLLMGMPREPTIFREVSAAGVKCLDVHINPGGCSWLHAIVQIQKASETDGRRVLEAAFRGHGSLKHCFVVDEDVDIYDPAAVEWAMATRFQGDRDTFVCGREPGSSLDPSAEPGSRNTYKMGFDLTRPVTGPAEPFRKAAFPTVNLADYLDE